MIYQWLLSIFLKNHKNDEEENPIEETQKTILHILQNSNIREKLDPIDKKLIESVVKFKDRIVREVMVPRIDLFSLSADTTIREAAKKLAKEGYSRVPVYRGSIDDIVGVLMFKDLFQLYMDVVEGKQAQSVLDNKIEPLAKSVFYAPETKRVSHLLQEFRTKLMHMAIVVDEYGGTEGVVTIEDILEEIVGQFTSSQSESINEINLQDDGSYLVDPRISIREINSALKVKLPFDNAKTLNGLILEHLQSFPQHNVSLKIESLIIEIIQVNKQGIKLVKINKIN